MNEQDLKNSILQLAIQGKLVEQRKEEGTAKELLEQIRIKKEQLIKEKKIRKTKALPEITEDQILFDIPESWEWVRLSEIGDIVGGGTPKTGNSSFWNGGNIPWLTPADMKFIPGKHVKNGQRFITEDGLRGSSAKLMPKGTIIYSSRAPIGYIGIAENDLATNQGFKSLVPYEISVNEYVYYCLISRTNEIISRASGTTFKEISGSEFGLTIIPLPPLEEQKRIVSKIEELMSYTEKYGESYSKVEELNKKFPEDMQKSILQYAIQGKLVEQREEEGTAEELYKEIQEEKEKLIKEGTLKKTKALPEIKGDEIPFDIPESWKWTRITNIADRYTGNSIPKSIREGKYSKVKEGYDYIATKDVEFNNVIKFENGIKIPYEEEKFKYSYKDSILMCIEGGSAGRKIGILDRKVCFGNKLCSFNSIIIEPLFLYYYLQSPQFINVFKENMTGIIGGVSITKLKSIILPLPPLEEQKRIVAKIEEMLLHIKQLVK